MNTSNISALPLILAPAGGRESFLAALAAGADAVYCGLKMFSARMAAQNFSMSELASLTALAHQRGVKVFVTLNTLIKPEEMQPAGEMLVQLKESVKPDALIIQDLSVVELTRQAGYSGGIILSTLANVGFGEALSLVKRDLGVSGVVLPRELTIDEIKALAAAAPPGLTLEVFVHGALCYAVSGRCYWSSYLGGKSGLRGRCVQPCRRRYQMAKRDERFFSCQDLSLDVLAKILRGIPQIGAWKIEGRKKGPHYVYYTVKAYQLFRDYGSDSAAKKEALALLAQALGRPGTHYNFLPQRPQAPANPQRPTGSGLMLGRIKGGSQRPYLSPQVMLQPGDTLRIGYEDGPAHAVIRIKAAVPKNGRFNFTPKGLSRLSKGTPVFLIDRREKGLQKMLTELAQQLDTGAKIKPARFQLHLPKHKRIRFPEQEIRVYRRLPRESGAGLSGLWLDPQNMPALFGSRIRRLWFWLPPVVWPEEAGSLREAINALKKRGAIYFVLNAPWQASFFTDPKSLALWAGPFCNLTNPLALMRMARWGFKGAFVSPELGRADYPALAQKSPLPLGIIISGNWPLCIARSLAGSLQTEQPFTSPKGETAFSRHYGENIWIYPGWELDLSAHKQDLQKAGYRLWGHLVEPWPRGFKVQQRPGLWNWKVGLK